MGFNAYDLCFTADNRGDILYQFGLYFSAFQTLLIIKTNDANFYISWL